MNTNNKRSIFFPSNYYASRFGNEDILFYILKSKYLNDYEAAFKHSNEKCGFSKIDYKLYYPNLLRNDEYIKNYQNNHRGFDFEKPEIVLKKKLIKKHLNK